MDFNLTKEQRRMIFVLLLALIAGLAVTAYRSCAGKTATDDMVIETPKEVLVSQVMVHISGAVRREGVYRLKAGDRLLDAIETAGGARPLADLSAVNLAEPVKDGEKIFVPLKSTEIKETESQTKKINLNAADEEGLDSLPGVGTATAKTIIEYRRSKGSFARIEQLMEIPRFGKAKFERIKDRVTI